MHFHLEIWLPSDTAYEQQVEGIMAPFCEHNHDNGWWDWYVIGGRWTGAHIKDYDPVKDERNWSDCEYCKDTPGMRQWPDGPKVCNACGLLNFETNKHTYPFGKGKSLNFSFVPFPLDICPVDVVDPEMTAYAFMAYGDSSPVFKEKWDSGTREFVPGGLDDTPVSEILKARGLDSGYLVTVDYHC